MLIYGHWVCISFNVTYVLSTKGGLISEVILTLVPLAKRGATSWPWAENLGKFFSVKAGKFKLSAQGQDFVLFVGNETKVKIPSEIKLPLE
jgi:hypothetical protein